MYSDVHEHHIQHIKTPGHMSPMQLVISIKTPIIMVHMMYMKLQEPRISDVNQDQGGGGGGAYLSPMCHSPPYISEIFF